MSSAANGTAPSGLQPLDHMGQRRSGALVPATSGGGNSGASMEAAAFYGGRSTPQHTEPVVPTAEFEAAIAAASSAAEESLAATRSQLEALHAEVRKRPFSK